MADLIDRQAAIDALMEAFCDTMIESICKDTIEALPSVQPEDKCSECDAWNKYKNYPSTQPERKWIPCSERLPENERKEYWVCTDAEYQCQCRWTNVNHFWTDLTTDWHWHWMDVPQYTEVIAWMPLPEPYRKDGE